jgi:hypothetical protein
VDGRRSVPHAHLRARGTRLLWVGLVALVWSGTGALPARAVDFQMELRASRTYWPGWWWPMQEGQGWRLGDLSGSFTPLVQYARFTGDWGPLLGERTYHMTDDPRAFWFGHCHAWAAASLKEPQPLFGVRGGSVTFDRGEIKGLATMAYGSVPTDFFAGARRDQGADFRTDLRPGSLHNAVLYFFARGEGIIANIADRPEVWSYPTDRVVMRGVTDEQLSDVTHITATFWFPINDVPPDFVGTEHFSRTLTYWVQGDPRTANGGRAFGWEGDSVQNHFQFIWHPAGPGPEFGLDYGLVKQMITVSAGQQATN